MTAVASAIWTPRVSARELAAALAGGAAVVLPTETVYGLAVAPEFVERAFELKGRPQEVNLPIVVGSVDQVPALGLRLDDAARALAEAFWPGPLTIVMGFDPRAERATWLTGRIEAAARMPDLDLLRETAAAGGPFLLTSANRHGDGAKLTAAEAVESLVGAPDLVLDGGRLSGKPSSLVNTRVSPPQIERLGTITRDEVRAVVPDLGE